MTLQFRQRATKDIQDVIDYRVLHSPDAAERFPLAVEETAQFLLRMLGVGELEILRRRQIHGLRKTPVRRFKRYMMFYVADRDTLTIVRVLHSARARDSLLGDDS